MNGDEFREMAEKMTSYILNFLKFLPNRPVAPKVSPGFLTKRLPPEPPQVGEPFEAILEDVENLLMPGMVHWEHPRFFAYFPASRSFSSTLAEMVADSVGVSALEWSLSPAAEELEAIVTDWYGRLMGLPEKFLRYGKDSRGGAIAMSSTSECVFAAMLNARDDFLRKLEEAEYNRRVTRADHLIRLVAYCSKEAHSCVEKAAHLTLVHLRVLESDNQYKLRGKTLAEAVAEDKGKGLVPFFVTTTLGTTSCGACDPLDEIGPVCTENEMWLHVDAAYAGTAMFCPEYRDLLRGIEHAQTYDVNPAKWARVNLECALLFADDRRRFCGTVVSDATALHHGSGVDDVATPTTRRCRAFKLWFTLSVFGAEGLRLHVRNHICLAEAFAGLVRADRRFELLHCRFGVVCFRLEGSNTLNTQLLKALNDSCEVHLIGTGLQVRAAVLRVLPLGQRGGRPTGLAGGGPPRGTGAGGGRLHAPRPPGPRTPRKKRVLVGAASPLDEFFERNTGRLILRFQETNDRRD